MKTWITLALLLFGAGCAMENLRDSSRQNVELMKHGAGALVSADRGMIFGEKCGGGGVSFGSSTKAEMSISPGWTTGQRFFFASLPAGTYSIRSIGSVHGALEGKPPFEFTVDAGKIKYIGALYPSWISQADQKCPLEWVNAVDSRIYELQTAIGPNLQWKVLLLNKGDVAVGEIALQYPNVDLSGYSVDLAK